MTQNYYQKMNLPIFRCVYLPDFVFFRFISIAMAAVSNCR